MSHEKSAFFTAVENTESVEDTVRLAQHKSDQSSGQLP